MYVDGLAAVAGDGAPDKKVGDVNTVEDGEAAFPPKEMGRIGDGPGAEIDDWRGLDPTSSGMSLRMEPMPGICCKFRGEVATGDDAALTSAGGVV